MIWLIYGEFVTMKKQIMKQEKQPSSIPEPYSFETLLDQHQHWLEENIDQTPDDDDDNGGCSVLVPANKPGGQPSSGGARLANREPTSPTPDWSDDLVVSRTT